MSIGLDVWSALGAQFLRLIVRSLALSSPVAKDSELAADFDHPLDGLSDTKIEEVYAIAAHILKAAASSSAAGRVESRADARAFFNLLSLNRDPGSDLPVASLSVNELRALLAHAWLPVGRGRDNLRNRLQQLAAATCNIRDALTGALGTSQIERHVWRADVIVTDGDLEYARAVLELPPCEHPSAPAAVPQVAPSALGGSADGSKSTVEIPEDELGFGAGSPLSPVLRIAVQFTSQGRFSMLEEFPSVAECC